MTQAALKWKIHYSSAKMIARRARRANEQALFAQTPRPTLQCHWKDLDQSPQKQTDLGG